MAVSNTRVSCMAPCLLMGTWGRKKTHMSCTEESGFYLKNHGGRGVGGVGGRGRAESKSEMETERGDQDVGGGKKVSGAGR